LESDLEGANDMITGLKDILEKAQKEACPGKGIWTVPGSTICVLCPQQSRMMQLFPSLINLLDEKDGSKTKCIYLHSNNDKTKIPCGATKSLKKYN
jgi:hypothetical protein